MNKKFLLIGIFITLLIGCKKSIPSITKYVGGIQINEADQKAWAKTLKKTGMNLAQVTAYAKQGNWDTDHLWWEDQDSSNVIREIRAIRSQGVDVIMVLRVALQHDENLYPLNTFKWHGMIFPKDRQLMKEWFYRYNSFVQMWAKICEREGVKIFAIGSEMNALTATQPIDTLPPLLEYFSNEKKQKDYEGRIFKYKNQLQEEDLWVRGGSNYQDQEAYIFDKIKEQKKWADQVCHIGKEDSIALINADRNYLDSMWRVVIVETRKKFFGTLTLAANFDNYHEVSFWDELDYIGINAYFPLRKISTAPIDNDSLFKNLVLGWEKVFEDIDTFKVKQQIPNHPIFFTEIGYTPKAECTTHPWQGDGFSLLTNGIQDTLVIWKKAKHKPEERILAMDALYEVTQRDSIPLDGLCYWKLTSHDYHEGVEPFMLLIGEDGRDSLQQSLSQFLERKVFEKKEIPLSQEAIEKDSLSKIYN